MENRFSGLMGELNSEDDSASPETPPKAKKQQKAQPKKQPGSEPEKAKPVPKSKDPNYQQIGVYLPKDLHQKMKIGSAVTGKEMSDIAAEGIRLWLKKHAPSI